ncbi:MAG: hypothetical protein UV46_C0015G0005 [Candidatus Gottesmanbacteria bacterium GW2011_GWC2_42_8]|nr:MAG: hypothetical protein UV46_C0015G0005 [Candidatus Gottesmanbacteria bacterium GW2011_GWC2_42_8]
MAQECELLPKCGFFRKYQATKDLACKGFIQMYCKGSMVNDCKRMEFRKKNGVPPVDEMMPNGAMIKV